MVKLSLVIPCYNEAANLPALIERCRTLAERPDVEVILVDNGSTDATATILPNLLAGAAGLRSVRVEVNQGYGAGILTGLQAANGDVLAWTHADLQTNPLDAERAFDSILAARDPAKLFVKGKRHGRALGDAMFTAGMSLFETVLTGRAMRDINAQPTMFHRSFFESWSSPPSDFSLDLFAYWEAKRRRLAIERIAVQFPPRLHGVSSWNVGLRAKWKFIRRTVGFSLKLRLAQGA